jgi:hypothetical protein
MVLLLLLRCPVCKAENTKGPACRRCKADLSMLFALEDRRARALADAGASLALGRWSEARTAALVADHLRQDCESKQLVALTALLCGDFHEALRLYRQMSTTGATA